MKLIEFLDTQDYETAYYDPNEDEAHQVHMNDTRKPVLTLKHLNRLKRIQAMDKLEKLKREDQLAIQYGIPDESEMGGAGMGGFGAPGF